jgi:hypothetical protein
MTKDVLITPSGGIIEFKDTAIQKASIYELNGDLHLDANGGDVVLGDGTPANVIIGDALTSVSLTFLGGGILSSGGNALSIGTTGDVVNLNVSGVTYNFPPSVITSADYTAADVLTKIKTVDGVGSGLDADFLDGLSSASTNTVSSIVARDASGNFSAGTITAALTGNATTASTLQTARTINGTSFNGSANITTTSWGTARTLTVGNTGKSVDGSANVSWTLAEIGAYAATNPSGYTTNTGTVTNVGGTGTVSGLTLTGTITTTGNLTLGGTLAVTPSNFASQTANTVLAAPNGAAGVPTFRALVPADIPTLNQNTTGSATLLSAEDNRVISPSELATTRARFGFTSWGNNNTAPYADFLHLRSYTDASGGQDNLVMFRKDAIGMRIWQQTFGSSTAYATYKDVAFTDSSITGSAATLTTGRTIGMTGDVTWTSASFNGSANVTGTATLANSGVAAGTYNNVTVNAKGLVTSGSNVSYLTSYTETDTLASVTSRGATTATAISLTNTGTSLTTSGNIGIKTSTPTVELEVNGSAYISGSGSIGSANGIYAGDLTDQQIFLRPGASGMPPSPMGLASLIEGSHNAYGYLQALRASTGDGINPHFLLGVSPEGVTLEEYGSVYGSLMFVTSTNERMRITATGELGLGVIPNTWDTSNNFSKVLELPRAALFTTDYFDTRVNLISNAYLSASSGFLYSTDGAATMYSMTADGSHVWYNMGSGLLGGSTIPDPMMVLTSSGNLGIGTGIISASEKLEVIGNIKADVFYARTDTSKYVDPAATSVLNKLTVSGSEPLTISSPFPSTNYILHSNTSGTNVIAFLGDGSLVTNATTDLDYAIRGGFGGRIVIATQNDGVLWVTPSTNVGIGNENPTYKLDVTGDARVTDKVTAGAMEVNSGIIESSATISANYTIAVGNNAMSTGPIAINSGVTVTVPSGSTWTII